MTNEIIIILIVSFVDRLDVSVYSHISFVCSSDIFNLRYVTEKKIKVATTE